MKYFTSDTHFGHKAILFFGRSVDFASVEEHDEKLIETWNKTVKPKDEIYHLGDWSMNGLTFMAPIFKRLNGKITTIRGNHDRSCWCDCDVLSVQTQKNTLFLSHYPHIEWPGSLDKNNPTIHLFGHVHGRVIGMQNSLDVGVDNAKKLLGEYRPFSIDEAIHFAKQ